MRIRQCSIEDAVRTHDFPESQTERCFCRFCTFRPVFGNLYFCETGGKLHVCDSNCTQRVYYDCSSTICRFVLCAGRQSVRKNRAAASGVVAHLQAE